jgi:hypothetical protein
MEQLEGSNVPKWDEVTYRDWVAATFMTALLTKYANLNPTVTNLAGNPYLEVAGSAYRYADAFMTMRKK